MKPKIEVEYSDKISCFELLELFSKILQNFLLTLGLCSRYRKGTPNLVPCVSDLSNQMHMIYETQIKIILVQFYIIFSIISYVYLK